MTPSHDNITDSTVLYGNNTATTDNTLDLSTTVSNSSSENGPDWFLNSVGLIRWFYLPVIVVGTVTNLMNMVVFCTSPMRHLTTTVYLAALAGGDIINLYAELFRYWVEWMDWLIPPELYFSDIYCKFGNYLGSASRDFTNWLVALVTIERTIVLAAPFRAKSFCTLLRARVIVVCLLVLILLAHIPSLIVTKAVRNVTWVCWGKSESDAVEIIMTIVFYGVSNSVVILVFVLNITLIILLYKARINTPSNSENNNQGRTKRLTGMLLAVGILFIVCEMPRLIVILLYTNYGGLYSLRIAMSVAFLLSGINHTANFFIYVLSGRRFRQVFFTTFHCICAAETGSQRTASITKLQTYRASVHPLAASYSVCTLDSNHSMQSRETIQSGGTSP